MHQGFLLESNIFLVQISSLILGGQDMISRYLEINRLVPGMHHRQAELFLNKLSTFFAHRYSLRATSLYISLPPGKHSHIVERHFHCRINM
jgi:hypothetical protein